MSASTDTVDINAMVQDDPFAAAMKAEVRQGSGHLFGQMTVSAWFCVLEKGVGKLPFDRAKHKEDAKRTAMDFILTLLGRPGSDPRQIERSLIAESKEWTKIIRPSLEKLGLEARTVNGRFVHLKFVPTGETYDDKRTGEKRDRTTIEFVEVFADEMACRASAEAFFDGDRQDDGNGSASAPTPIAAPANSKERETAKNFILPLWNAAGGDRVLFAQQLAANPLLSKHFTVDSPEVQAVIGAAAGVAAG